MRRTFYAVALIAMIAVAIVAYRRATETVVIERPSLNGPPPTVHMPPVANVVGHPLPAIDTVDAKALHNRIVIVSVGATWCRPCRDEMPRIEKEIVQVHPNDVAVVPISAEDAAAVRRIPPIFAHHAPIPRVYVADRAGIIRYQHVGYSPSSFEELKSVVDRLTRESRL